MSDSKYYEEKTQSNVESYPSVRRILATGNMCLTKIKNFEEGRDFSFVFKVAPGRMGECMIQIKKQVLPGHFLVVLTDSVLPGSYSAADFITEIASQIYRKILQFSSANAEKITWVIRANQGSPGEDTFQKIQLSWDGERYELPELRGRFNGKAFQAAFANL